MLRCLICVKQSTRPSFPLQPISHSHHTPLRNARGKGPPRILSNTTCQHRTREAVLTKFTILTRCRCAIAKSKGLHAFWDWFDKACFILVGHSRSGCVYICNMCPFTHPSVAFWELLDLRQEILSLSWKPIPIAVLNHVLNFIRITESRAVFERSVIDWRFKNRYQRIFCPSLLLQETG